MRRTRSDAWEVNWERFFVSPEESVAEMDIPRGRDWHRVERRHCSSRVMLWASELVVLDDS